MYKTKVGVEIIVHNHSYADKYKGGFHVFRCKACGKIIIKGKPSPDRAFGRQ